MSNRVTAERTFSLVLTFTRTFYNSRLNSYNETQDPIGDLEQVKSYAVGHLIAMSNK
jgi:hypothetical protein